MTTPESKQAVVIVYRAVETDVGTDIEAHIQCFEAERDQESVEAFRVSAPFVLARGGGTREIVPGSILESLRNIRQHVADMAISSERHVTALTALVKGPAKAAQYASYERTVLNGLVLVSCLLRNILDVFPRLNDLHSVPMFDYERSPVEPVRLRVLLDLLIHSRHVSLDGEYVADLFSDKSPEGTVIADLFMGYRFKVNDFLRAAQDAISGITVKDLAQRLRSGIRSLHAHTPHHEMVFLLKNAASFSDLLRRFVTTDKDALFGILFPKTIIPPKVVSQAKGRKVTVKLFFRPPRVRIGDRVDEGHKSVVVTSTAWYQYIVNGEMIHAESCDRVQELDYADFLDRVVKKTGDEPLLAASDDSETASTNAVEP